MTRLQYPHACLVFAVGHTPPYCQFPPMPWFVKKLLVPWVFWWRYRSVSRLFLYYCKIYSITQTSSGSTCQPGLRMELRSRRLDLFSRLIESPSYCVLLQYHIYQCCIVCYLELPRSSIGSSSQKPGFLLICQHKDECSEKVLRFLDVVCLELGHRG